MNAAFFITAARLIPPVGKARADELFKACREAGVLTIGIGDGGNEIGMGGILMSWRRSFLP